MAQQALQRVKGRVQQLFDKNLSDLVRGIRNNKDDESGYIAQCLEEIKQELKHANLAVKSNAVAKLTYLQMLGYDISWATFNIIEVMNSTRFSEKRLGYLAASITFRPDTDILMLTTNMIRKDLNSVHQYESGIALSSLSCFISHDLARDLNDDVLAMLSSSRPYIRKKAVLLLYKVFLKYPDALRASFPKLREKLEDPDPGVQSAAVNVICELARKNPKNYLGLAPTFFKLMTNSANNWMLIKIIKLFAALTPLEPRLGKKLIEPLTNLIHSTSAMSLLYECINTVIAVLISISSGMPNHSAAVQLCVQKLRILIEDSDQNLKYLGLLAMSKILRTHPKSVQNHKDMIMQCLDDSDESIRLRALDLLYGMVNKKNLAEITQKLLNHLEKAEGTLYRDELISKVMSICSQNDYQYVTNFEWYISVLVELSRIRGNSQHGALIASQLMDVAIRVESVRAFTVAQMALLIDNAHLLLLGSNNTNSSQSTASAIEVLFAAAYICGEFGEHLSNPSKTLLAMLKVKTSFGRVQAVFIHNALKLLVYIACTEENETFDQTLVMKMMEVLKELSTSFDLEVQERASTTLQLLQCLESITPSQFQTLFKGELNPVAPKAQKRVPVPEGLDLDQWINQPVAVSDDDEGEDYSDDYDDSENIFVSRATSSPLRFKGNSDEEKEGKSKKKKKKKKHKKRSGSQETDKISKEELERRREARIQAQNANPNYLKDTKTPSKKDNKDDDNNDEQSVDSKVQPIDMDVPLYIPGLASSEHYLNIGKEGKKKKKKEKEKEKKTAEEPKSFVVSKNVEMPPDLTENHSDNNEHSDSHLAEDDPHRALAQIRLDDLEYKKPFGARKEEVKFIETNNEEEKTKSKKKKKKNKEEKVDGEDSSIKKKKKKKSNKKKEGKDGPSDQMLKDNTEVPDPSKDVDFWLQSKQ